MHHKHRLLCVCTVNDVVGKLKKLLSRVEIHVLFTLHHLLSHTSSTSYLFFPFGQHFFVGPKNKTNFDYSILFVRSTRATNVVVVIMRSSAPARSSSCSCSCSSSSSFGKRFLGGTKGDDQRMHCRKAYRIQKREEDAEEKAARHARCRRQRKTERS